MKITHLRDKILLGVVTISLMLALAFTSAVFLIIRRQYLDQSNALLLTASRIINDNLNERKENQLKAARQLAKQKYLGSTIWYLTKYARSNIDHETLFNTYQQMVQDTYRTGLAAEVSKIAIYNSAGDLVTFAMFDGPIAKAGFVEHSPHKFFVSALKEGDDLSRKNLQRSNSIDKMQFEFKGDLPKKESTSYEVVDGLLSLQTFVPIMGEAFDPISGKVTIRQLGLIAMTLPLDQAFITDLSRLTDTDINVFSPDRLSSGSLTAYQTPDLSGRQTHSKNQLQSVTLNEIKIKDKGFYQGLIPLYNNQQFAGSIATLHSKEVVQKNIREMLQTLWLIAAAILLLIFPFVWFFSSSISRPISSLSRIFRDVASGKQSDMMDNELLSLERESQRGDEFGDLTKSFITMHEAINQKILQINEINASLEQTIQERTAALVLKEQESRTVIENSPDAIVRYDLECRRIYVNPGFVEMAGSNTAALLGQTPMKDLRELDIGIYERKIKEVVETGISSQHELKWLGKDGKEFYNLIRLTPEFDLSGKVVSVLGVGRDITELKLIEEQLRNAILSRDEFISIASHELRNPLMALRLQLRSLLRKSIEVTNDNESQLVSMSEKAIRMEMHLGRLVNELFDITRIRAGKLEFKKHDMELTSQVSEVISRMSDNIKRSGSTVELFAPLPINGHWDSTRVDQIITNLISNAIKYGEGKPINVDVTTISEKNMAKIEVQDHGVGISPEQHLKIFKQFERVNINKDISGLGLGLFIVKQLVEAHGGTINVSSNLGEGSKFTVELPL